ncbi:MAG: ribonuclease PH [Verrucomicrobiota bacterium]
MERVDKRAYNELRPVTFQAGIAPHSTGSVLVSFGETRVICSAMIEEKVPKWMQFQNVPGGWLTAEYNMLPYSTLDRKQRDSTRGKVDGRSTEIQRLIGRSLRAVVDLKALGPRTVWVDCDVLQADGGTRTASITGGCVAIAIAFNKLIADGLLEKSPLKQLLAAVSCGVVDDVPLLDLCYVEDRDADVDFNVVMTDKMEFVELQGSGEEAVFSSEQLTDMLDLAKKGVGELVESQRAAIAAADSAADEDALADLASHFTK